MVLNHSVSRHIPIKQSLWRTIVTVLLSIVAQVAYPSFPMVRNFMRTDYNGGSQTWAITQDTLGNVYYGNKYGLITYDSHTWVHHALSNESEVRSIYYDIPSGRLYAGGTEEFGYFEHCTRTHTMVYHSLKSLLKREQSNFKDIWNIVATHGSIWFQGDYELFQYTHNQIKKIPAKYKISTSALIGDNIYIGFSNGHLGRLAGGKIAEYEAPILEGKKIVGITPAQNGGVYIFTEFDGLYRLDGNSVQSVLTSFDSFMRDNQVFCVAYSPTALAIGTVNRGILVKSTTDNALTYVSRETGLQNNTVLTLAFDRLGNLWAGLDNGIDYINYNSPFRRLLGHSAACGTGYISFLNGNDLYLGTNQGLYLTSYPISAASEEPTLKQLIRGQIWHIDQVGEAIFASTDGGLYDISNGTPHKIDGIPGSWAVQRLRNQPDYALVSTYDNFYLLHLNGQNWDSAGKVSGYNDIGGYYHQDERGNIWITHWMRGIYRLRINPALQKFDLVQFYDNRKGLPQAKGNGITSYGDQIVFSTAKGFYIYDPVGDIMKPHPTLNTLFGNLESGALVHTPDNDIWNLGAAHTIGLARSTPSGGYEVDSTTFAPMGPKMVHGFENFNFITPNEVIISGEEGFYVLNSAWRPDTNTHFPLRVASISVGADSVIYHERDSIKPKIPYALNSVRFQFVLPEYRSEAPVEYSCMLEDYDKEWNILGTKSEKEYTGLREGDYTLRLKAKNLYTRQTEESTIRFTVLAPWYRSWWAKIFYILCFIILVSTAFRAMKRYEKRKQEAATRKKDDELNDMRRRAEAEALAKEVEISALKGEQLELQVRHKSEELSNAMLNLARKNEMLLNISGSLSKLQSQLEKVDKSVDTNTEIKNIQSLISENISHDDDWRKFTHNFDAVYEGFTKRLQELHPTLTRTELKVCCYLRMGLSSKDMAPLFSISYRSVEMTRYRLRKKLNLTREINLSEYLESL